MNLAGMLAYLFRREEDVASGPLDDAVRAVGDEYPKSFDALLGYAESLRPVLTPVHYEEMRATGATGLFYIEQEDLFRAFDGDASGFPDKDEAFTKIVYLGDGTSLVYPQDTRVRERVVIWAPSSDGPESLRLARLDVGVDLESGSIDKPTIEQERCVIGFSGLRAEFRKTCLPGSCTGPCGNGWSLVDGSIQLTGCRCG